MSGRMAKGRLLLYYLGNGPRTSTAALATVDFCGRKTIEFPHGGGRSKMPIDYVLSEHNKLQMNCLQYEKYYYKWEFT